MARPGLRSALAAFVVAAALVAAPVAGADEGPDLAHSDFVLEYCDPDKPTADPDVQMYCVGFVAGFVHANVIANRHADANFICLPEGGVSTDQALRVWVKSLRDTPENLHHHPRTTLFLALNRAFPCANGKDERN